MTADKLTNNVPPSSYVRLASTVTLFLTTARLDTRPHVAPYELRGASLLGLSFRVAAYRPSELTGAFSTDLMPEFVFRVDNLTMLFMLSAITYS